MAISEERRAQLREAGRKGGTATFERHGSVHMSRIGKEGFRAVANYLGDNGAAVAFLQKRHGMARLPRTRWSHDKCWNNEGAR